MARGAVARRAKGGERRDAQAWSSLARGKECWRRDVGCALLAAGCWLLLLAVGGLAAGDSGGLLAPPLPESPRLEGNREASIQIMLHGLTGELDGRNYEGLMAPFGAGNDDEWVASILTFVRREWGNSGSVVLPSHVAATREKFRNRIRPWRQEELSWKLSQKK